MKAIYKDQFTWHIYRQAAVGAAVQQFQILWTAAMRPQTPIKILEIICYGLNSPVGPPVTLKAVSVELAMTVVGTPFYRPLVADEFPLNAGVDGNVNANFLFTPDYTKVKPRGLVFPQLAVGSLIAIAANVFTQDGTVFAATDISTVHLVITGARL